MQVHPLDLSIVELSATDNLLLQLKTAQTSTQKCRTRYQTKLPTNSRIFTLEPNTIISSKELNCVLSSDDELSAAGLMTRVAVCLAGLMTRVAVLSCRADLMIKKLRYYARFIVVCLLVRKIKLVRDLARVRQNFQRSFQGNTKLVRDLAKVRRELSETSPG